jgi:hypothetical protein
MRVHRNQKGEKNSNAVLTDEAIHEIFHLVEKGMLQRKIAEIYGVTQPCISNLLHKRRWPHIYAEVFKGAPPKDFRFRSGWLNIIGQSVAQTFKPTTLDGHLSVFFKE